MGLFVVGRLAAQHGLVVRLRSTIAGRTVLGHHRRRVHPACSCSSTARRIGSDARPLGAAAAGAAAGARRPDAARYAAPAVDRHRPRDHPAAARNARPAPAASPAPVGARTRARADNRVAVVRRRGRAACVRSTTSRPNTSSFFALAGTRASRPARRPASPSATRTSSPPTSPRPSRNTPTTPTFDLPEDAVRVAWSIRTSSSPVPTWTGSRCGTTAGRPPRPRRTLRSQAHTERGPAGACSPAPGWCPARPRPVTTRRRDGGADRGADPDAGAARILRAATSGGRAAPAAISVACTPPHPAQRRTRTPE